MSKITMEQIEKLAESPMVQKAIAESERDAERALDEQRRRDVAAIAAITKASEKEMPGLNAAYERTTAKVDELKKALLAAQQEQGQAFTARLSASNATAQALADRQRSLMGNPPQEALDFVRWSWDRFDQARTSGRVEVTWRKGNRDLGQRVTRYELSNVASLAEYIGWCLAARIEVLQLISDVRLAEPSRQKIRDRVQELYASEPVVTTTEVEN
ncbi:MAG: hypothetical protein E6J20_17235 [Chloroflexi bacterium]|nr:MAG: hypothetical protein E6J20_17235 [Chloroflexota bacterium]